MAIKKWKITAQVDMDASRHDSVIVEANTERKARIKSVEALKAKGHFFVCDLKVEQLEVK